MPPAEIAEVLERRKAAFPQLLLSFVNLWLRLEERIRLRRQGARWMTGYRSSPPTDGQISLIRDLGLRVGHNTMKSGLRP